MLIIPTDSMFGVNVSSTMVTFVPGYDVTVKFVNDITPLTELSTNTPYNAASDSSVPYVMLL